MSAAGFEAYGVKVNVGNDTVEKYGKVDIVVNNAGVGMTKNVASQYGPQNIRCNAIAQPKLI